MSSISLSAPRYSEAQISLVDPIYSEPDLEEEPRGISLVDPIYSEENANPERIQNRRYPNARPLTGRIAYHLVKNPPERPDCVICTEPLILEDALRGNCSAHLTETFTLEELNENEPLHHVHSSCIQIWRSTKRNAFDCPICRVSTVNAPPLDLRPKEWQELYPIEKIPDPFWKKFPAAYVLVSSLGTTALAKAIEYTFSTSPLTALAGASLIGAAATGKTKQLAKGFMKGLVLGEAQSLLGNWIMVPWLLSRGDLQGLWLLSRDEVTPFQFAAHKAYNTVAGEFGMYPGVVLALDSLETTAAESILTKVFLVGSGMALSTVRGVREEKPRNMAGAVALSAGITALSFGGSYAQAAQQAFLAGAGFLFGSRQAATAV